MNLSEKMSVRAAINQISLCIYNCVTHCGIGVKSAPLFFLMFPGNFLVVRIVILEGPVKEFSKKNHARHRAGQKPIKNFTLLNN